MVLRNSTGVMTGMSASPKSAAFLEMIQSAPAFLAERYCTQSSMSFQRSDTASVIMDSPAAATLMYLSMSVIVEYISAGDIAFRNTYARLTNEMSEATSDSLLCLESSSSTRAASTHGLRLRTMSISIFVSRKTLTARTSQKNTRLFPLRDPGCV